MQKQNDVLKQYASARASLEREREEIAKRLQQIDAVLGGAANGGVPHSNERPSTDTSSGRRSKARPNNSMNIREAVGKVTAKKPLTVREIVEAVEKIGYKFASSNPVNSVGAYLYGAGKKVFKRKDGKFSPV